VLLWIGIYKFTPTEAKLIEPLVKNHFLMGWLYQVFSIQTVSNLVGSAEIIVLFMASKTQKLDSFQV